MGLFGWMSGKSGAGKTCEVVPLSSLNLSRDELDHLGPEMDPYGNNTKGSHVKLLRDGRGNYQIVDDADILSEGDYNRLSEVLDHNQPMGRGRVEPTTPRGFSAGRLDELYDQFSPVEGSQAEADHRAAANRRAASNRLPGQPPKTTGR